MNFKTTFVFWTFTNFCAGAFATIFVQIASASGNQLAALLSIVPMMIMLYLAMSVDITEK